MTRLHRNRAERTRRRNRALLLVGLSGFAVAAVGFFAAGLIGLGLTAAVAGALTVAAAGRHARPANWTPESPDDKRR